MYQAYRVDATGMFVEPVLFEDNIIPLDTDIVLEEIPEGLHHPRWDGTQWIEGRTQAEISALQNAIQPKTLDQEISELKQVVADIAALQLGV